MRWDVDPDRARAAPPGADPRARGTAPTGPGWWPARAAGPVFLLLGILLLWLGSGLPPHPTPTSRLLTGPPTVRVDLNHDPPERLVLIPGIGPRRARAIAAFRATHGPFTHSRDLLRVPGVGPSLVRRLAPLLPTTPPTTNEPGLTPRRFPEGREAPCHRN